MSLSQFRLSCAQLKNNLRIPLKYVAYSTLFIFIPKFTALLLVEITIPQPWPFDILNKFLLIFDIQLLLVNILLLISIYKPKLFFRKIILVYGYWMFSSLLALATFICQLAAVVDIFIKLNNLDNENAIRLARANLLMAAFYTILIVLYVYFTWLVAVKLLEKKNPKIGPLIFRNVTEIITGQIGIKLEFDNKPDEELAQPPPMQSRLKYLEVT